MRGVSRKTGSLPFLFPRVVDLETSWQTEKDETRWQRKMGDCATLWNIAIFEIRIVVDLFGCLFHVRYRKLSAFFDRASSSAFLSSPLSLSSIFAKHLDTVNRRCAYCGFYKYSQGATIRVDSKIPRTDVGSRTIGLAPWQKPVDWQKTGEK